MELLIVVGILTLLVAASIAFLNPFEQFARAKDAQRKNDLNELRKIMESWYSDRGCYPKKSQLCFNDLSTNTCEICTSAQNSPSLAAYTTSTLCDPEPALRNYLYVPEGNDLTCPLAYVIYTKLGAIYNKENDVYSCGSKHACGPGQAGYDYLVSSPNAYIDMTSAYFCTRHTDQACVACGTYDQCLAQVANYKRGRQAACYDEAKIYITPSCN